jgi:GNAT superfamily N-acetyltransferase
VTPEELLARFHAEVRLAGADLDPDHVVEQDGPVRREYPPDASTPGAMVECPGGLPAAEADRWIARQRDFFLGRGQEAEWKVYGYDTPTDLSERLTAAGFEPGEEEVVLLGEAAALMHDVALPAGLRLTEVVSDEDWERTRAFMDGIFGTERSWYADRFREEQRARPGTVHAVAVEEEDRRVVCFGRLSLTPGCPFAGLWGGTTDPAWRGRGLYRATVAHRARRALAAGAPLVRVDTSVMSRPVLVRLGLHPVATTTPHVLRPR